MRELNTDGSYYIKFLITEDNLKNAKRCLTSYGLQRVQTKALILAKKNKLL